MFHVLWLACVEHGLIIEFVSQLHDAARNEVPVATFLIAEHYDVVLGQLRCWVARLTGSTEVVTSNVIRVGAHLSPVSEAYVAMYAMF